jgi:CubicO group peptidase (beta-lactamase class C family)
MAEYRRSNFRLSQRVDGCRGNSVRIAALIASIRIAIAPQLTQAHVGCGAPTAAEDQWPVAAPETVGLDGAALCGMVKWLDDWKEGNVHAVLVARRGVLVFEHYFSGSDEHWGRAAGDVNFGPETKHDERSVTKSVVALVLGIAIDRGWVNSVNEPVLSFFPQYSDLRTPEKDRITLRHLLTMSAGLEWHEYGIAYTDQANSQTLMDSARDPYRYVLEQKVVTAAGRSWNYSSGSTELLGAVLKKATGEPLDELARKVLFGPLGITDIEWHKDARGNPIASGGLRLRPRDLAKIGQLVLQRGAWNGAHVVPASWVDAATTPQINDPPSISYGYQFWLDRSNVGNREVAWAVGIGLGGQRLYIAPALDLVVVVNAGLYKSDLQGTVPWSVLSQYVLKAMEPHLQ